jgi:hypothetical protein
VRGRTAEVVGAQLTSAEKVQVVSQLSSFGMKAGDITKQTRIKATRFEQPRRCSAPTQPEP